ncbi:MAG: hypothetical protein ACOCYE_02395 [Pseudomonadota bacterium]
MLNRKRVVLVGLDPTVVDYGKWPGLTPARLRAALDHDRAALQALGYETEVCYVDGGATAALTLQQALAGRPVAAVLIGAGVRTDPDCFHLFETLVNVAHRAAPEAALCFNTEPSDSLQAVQRWV